ncbi:MAG TPA: fructosamine kinase family protein [Beutenbergiaceae bacterium]|nr:fructosamine kinase family protein [Beutenbergiaceae bacterium]
MTYRKHSPGAPAGFFAAEAAGLRWLAEPGVLPVVEVIEAAPTELTLQRLTAVPPSAEAAREFGAGLARLHSSGAPDFGFTPGEGRAWFGPLSDPFEVPPITAGEFGEFWAHRLRHVTGLAARELQRAQVPLAPFQEVIEAVASGAFNGISGSGTEGPSRVHGDLWSGNLMWTPEGGTLIDPAAHGGHRLEDLAMLALFGAPYLEEIFAGYEAEYPMPPGWQGDLPAHYLFGLIAHVYLFGGGYAAGAHRAARDVLRRAGD